ncbi:MAG TPA: PaaI family thioesterase [Thermoleophilaceae bacterium]|nr:PaaI family thioesterase [Thermoleophilaceae bacterium]
MDIRAELQRAMEGRLPGLLGIELLDAAHGAVEARLPVRPEHLAPNDFLHAGTIVTLADSCCGMGCIASLPEGAGGFTTVELKSNFLRTADSGALHCRATLLHGGRRTQVWDAEVTREGDGKTVALFRCTQYLLPAGDPQGERDPRTRLRLSPPPSSPD